MKQTHTGSPMISWLIPKKFLFKQVRQGVTLTQDGGTYMPEDGSGKLVAMQHMADQMALCVATASGHVLLWTPGSDLVGVFGINGKLYMAP